MGLSRRLAALLSCAVAVLTAALLASPARADDLPVGRSWVDGIAAMLAHPGSAPPGSNDWSCAPTSAHPYPVVLVHGTFADMTGTWQGLSPLLKNAGYCVFALNYGGDESQPLFHGYGRIENSAAELGGFVDQVLQATGAPKVDIVGVSQGGLMPRYYLKNYGGAAKVDHLVGLSPTNHGTTMLGLTRLLDVFPWGDQFLTQLCAACEQQVVGSQFLTDLNAGGETVPGVKYTVIISKYDEINSPYTEAFLTGANVTNIKVQDQCVLDFADHAAINYDPIALHNVLNALDPVHATRPRCVPVLPVLG